MKVLRNEYLIKADKDANSKKKIGDTEIFIDTSYDTIANAVKVGEIFEVPLSFDEDYKGGAELKKGDKVFFHQFVVQPTNIINIDGQDYYRAHYGQVFCKVENEEIVALDKWVFVLPIEDGNTTSASGIITKLTPDYVKNRGYIHRASPYAQELGLKEGDLIHFMDDADYPLEINGVLYYRMRIDSVICVEENNQLKPLNNKIVVKEDEYKDESIIIVPKQEKQQKYGNVLSTGNFIDNVKKDDRICFVYGLGTKTMLNDVEYRVIRKDHILWKVTEKVGNNVLGIELFA